MLCTIRIASLKISGDRRSELEAKVGKKVMQICNKKLFDKTKSIQCNVEWIDDETSVSFSALINVYYTFDDSDVENNHCSVCRDTHDLFYCNRQYNCSQCEYAAFKIRRQEKYKEMKRAGRYVLNRDK